MRNSRIEVEDRYLDQTNTQQHEDKWNFKNYLNLKKQIIRNLQEIAETDDDKYVKKSEMLEMWKQEIDLSTQLLENK